MMEQTKATGHAMATSKMNQKIAVDKVEREWMKLKSVSVEAEYNDILHSCDRKLYRMQAGSCRERIGDSKAMQSGQSKKPIDRLHFFGTSPTTNLLTKERITSHDE